MEQREHVEQLLIALEQLQCIDSTLNIRVDFETLAAFEGEPELIEDDEGDDHFYSKEVLVTPGPIDDSGSGVVVRLWAAPPVVLRRLTLVGETSRER